MADVITRFKLETTQYDSKLRDASKGLAEYTRQATQAGNEFGKFTQKNVEAARALGSITPSATNAKDKVKELAAAFNDTARAYNALTVEQQQSDFGKAMAESIGKLKDQLREAKQELYGMGDAVKNAQGGLFSGMGDKMSGMLQVFGGNMLTKAAGAAASLGLEILESVHQGVELARQGEGIRVAFERLGRGDILDGLREATHGTVTDLELMKAAVKFNDFKLPVEELGTMLAFAQQKAKDTGQSVDYMVDSIVTGLGRKSLMILDNLGLSASEIKDRMAETGDMTKAVADIIRDQMSNAGDYVETAADKAARSEAELQNAMEALGRTMLPLQEQGEGMWSALQIGALNLLNEGLTPIVPKVLELEEGIGDLYDTIAGSSVIGGLIDWMETGIEVTSRWIPLLGILRGLMQGNAAGSGASIGGAIAANNPGYQAVDNIGDIVVAGNSKNVKRTSGRAVTDPSTKIFQQFDTAMLKSAVGAESLKPETVFGPSGASLWAEMSEEMKRSMLGLAEVAEDYGDAMAKVGERDVHKEIQANIERDNKALKEQQVRMNLAAEAANNLGAAFASMDDPAAKAAGTVMQAVASIALGFAMASSSATTAGTGWGWLAWLAAGTAAMATTISTIHSLTGYANGGVVKGSSYSGDNIPALVDGSELVGLNAGEIVLNAAQQSNVAQNLQGAGLQNLNLTATVRGEDIKLALNNNSRRTGKGEYITTNFR